MEAEKMPISETNRPTAAALVLPEIVERVAPHVDGAEAKILNYYKLAKKHEASVADLNGEAATLVANSSDASLAEIRSRGSEIRRRQQDLGEARISLLWKRHELVESLVDAFAEYAPVALANHEEIRRNFAETLREMGVDEYTFEQGWANPHVARQRLEHLAETDLAILSSRAAANRARAAAEALETAVRILPSDAAAHIAWPSFAADRELASLAGLA